MYKKIIALFLIITSVTSDCINNKGYVVRDKDIALTKINAAKSELNNMSKHTSSAYMGATISGLGLVGSIATLSIATSYWGKGNPELQNYVLGTCCTAVAAGLFVAWVGQNDLGNPKEREKLIEIIEKTEVIAENCNS